MRQEWKTCLLVVTLLLSFVFPVWSATSADRRQVVVSVYDDVGVSEIVLTEAEQHAARIFERAGVQLLWANCSLARVDRPDGGCNRFEWPGHMALRITDHSLGSGEVFGVAFLSAEGRGCYSDIFYDRARELHANWKVGMADILGSVMAHELGHLLLGSNAHSGAGIMQARWQGGELHRLSRGNLGFSNAQAERMRGN